MTQIDSGIRSILERGRSEANRFYLPNEQLDRKTYQQVNDALTALGGKWTGGKIKAHVFPEDVDVAAFIAHVVETGEKPISVHKRAAFFPTPAPVAALLIRGVEYDFPSRVLEPSAGHGALIDAFLDEHPDFAGVIDAVELLPENVKVLQKKYANEPRVHVIPGNVLNHQAEPYNLVLCNPPFATPEDKFAWITHLQHYFGLLAVHGVLAGIAPNSLQHGMNNKAIIALRETIQAGGHIEPAEPGAFKESGTGVATVLFWTRKRETRPEPKRKKSKREIAAERYEGQTPEQLLDALERNERAVLRGITELKSLLADTLLPAQPSIDHSKPLTQASLFD